MNLRDTVAITASWEGNEGIEAYRDHQNCLLSHPSAPLLPAPRNPSSILTVVEMSKKRKHDEASGEGRKKDEAAPKRPKRTLTGWKSDHVEKQSDAPVFRNKEKVLITCSCRIISRYRHLMLNMVSLLPHSKKDNKVESEQSKGATLNELVEFRNCSYCLFF